MNLIPFLKQLKIFGNKANGPAVLDANGDLVGQIVPRTGNLADLQALAGTAGEFASATDYPAIVQFTGTAGQAKTTFPTASGLRAAVVPTIPGFIGANTTVTIGTGKNFATMTLFKTFIEQCVVDESATITLVCDNGLIADDILPTAGRTWPHIALCSDQTQASATVTGVSITASGAAGAWTLTLGKTGLAASIGLTATDTSRMLVITDGTAGTNPDNAVGVYYGITYVNADTVSVTSASTLTAMPTVSPTCTIYAPRAHLNSLVAGGTSGNIRSITLGSSTNAPVTIGTLSCKYQTIKGIGTNALVVLEIPANPNTYDIGAIYTWGFVPVLSKFPQTFTLITDGFAPVACTAMQPSGFFIDQGYGTTSYTADDTNVSLGAHTIINTLADGQLQPFNGSFWQVSSMTINGTAVSAVNLANYTTLTPGTLGATGGFIYFG